MAITGFHLNAVVIELILKTIWHNEIDISFENDRWAARIDG